VKSDFSSNTTDYPLADSSKFGRKGFGRICGLEDVDQIITDSGIEDAYKEKLMKLGIDVLVLDIEHKNLQL
jgi:DeoR family transcriptional regulator of aga operon